MDIYLTITHRRDHKGGYSIGPAFTREEAAVAFVDSTQWDDVYGIPKIWKLIVDPPDIGMDVWVVKMDCKAWKCIEAKTDNRQDCNVSNALHRNVTVIGNIAWAYVFAKDRSQAEQRALKKTAAHLARGKRADPDHIDYLL